MFLKGDNDRGGVDCVNGLVVAKGIVDGFLKAIDERIETVETLKKIPDFNSNLAVEQCFNIAFIKVV